MIKRLIAVTILSAITACASFTGGFVQHETYADCGVIMEDIEEMQDDFYEIPFVTQNGNEFVFKSEDGDWSKGDIVSAIFSDNGTPTVTDDEILSVRYSGYVSDEELQNWIK